MGILCVSHLTLRELDDKGRVNIPKEVREQATSEVFHVYWHEDSRSVVLKTVNVKRKGDRFSED